MPYGMYQLYQAERGMSDAERRQVDVQLGMISAEMSQMWTDLIRPVRGVRGRVRTAWALLSGLFVMKTSKTARPVVRYRAGTLKPEADRDCRTTGPTTTVSG